MITIEQDARFMTVGEAAQLLHVAPCTIRRRITRGELAAVRLGDSPRAPIRIAPAQLAEHVWRSR